MPISFNMFDGEWERKFVSAQNGSIILNNSNSYITTKKIISCNENFEIKLLNNNSLANGDCYIIFYNDKDEFSGYDRCNLYNKKIYTVNIDPSLHKKFYFMVYINVNEPIIGPEIVIHSVSDTLLNYALMASPSKHIISGSLNDYLEIGCYRLSSDHWDDISNTPPGVISKAGTLINLYAAAGVMQLFISVGAEIYTRLMFNGIEYIGWKCNNDNDMLNYYSIKNDRATITNGKLSEYIYNFVYPFFSQSNEIIDLPDELKNTGAGGSLINFKGCGSSGTHILQVLFNVSNTGKVYHRMLLNDGSIYKNWMEINSLTGTQFNSETVYYSFGDSITQGSYSYYDDDNHPHSVVAKGDGYPDLIAKINGYKKYVNLGLAGGGWLKNYAGVQNVGWIDTLNENDLSDATLITIMPYINDLYTSPLGTVDSPDTEQSIAGIFKWGINKILEQAPLATIIIIATPALKNNTSKANLNTLIKNISSQYGFPFIDLQNNNCISNTTYSVGYPDGTHPSLDEFKQIARYLAPLLPK